MCIRLLGANTRTWAWVNLDWTDARADDPTTLVAPLQEDRGRSTPWMWTTVRRSELEDRRFGHVETSLERLRAAVPRARPRGPQVAPARISSRGVLPAHARYARAR